MTQWALHANRLDLSGAVTAQDAAAVVRSSSRDADPAVTTVGVGFRDALWPDAPTVVLLDSATGSQPTALVSHDLHSVWLNSAAASRYAVQVDAFGLLREEPAFAVTRELGRLPCAVVDDGGKGLLRVGPLKVLIDGALDTRTAFCVDPYPLGGHGLLTVGPEELLALLERARDTGFLPAVHAIGDAANQVALDAFERAGVGGRIEHAQFVRREDFVRFGALGVLASVQPVHALDDRDAAETNWPGRTDRAFPLRSLLDSGASLLLGSDAPVAARALGCDGGGDLPGPGGRAGTVATAGGDHARAGPSRLDAGASAGSGRGSGRPRAPRRRSRVRAGRRLRCDARGGHAGFRSFYVRRRPGLGSAVLSP